MNLKKRMKYKVCVCACVGVGGWGLKLFSHTNWKIRLGHCLKMSFLTNLLMCYCTGLVLEGHRLNTR